jgi:hypothetical protein
MAVEPLGGDRRAEGAASVAGGRSPDPCKSRRFIQKCRMVFFDPFD